jgi:RND superfamily putative drug exporter
VRSARQGVARFEMSDPTVSGRIARAYAWTIVALRIPIILAWIAALIAALVFLPWLGGSSSAPLGDIIPTHSKALEAQERALRLFGSTVSTDTMMVDRNPKGLTRPLLDAHTRQALAASRGRGLPGLRMALPITNAPVAGLRWREHGTAVLTYLFLDPALNLLERERLAHRYADQLPPVGAGETRAITGAGPARLAQFREIDRVLPWIEIATVLVILVIVAVYFRSLGAPLVTLATAGLAYVIAVRVLAWLGERADVSVPSEIEPVLIVLLLGVVTDYTVFFMSETRQRLRRGEPRLVAARGAAARIAPLVLAAGILIAGGALALLAGKMQFFRVFGPGLAVTALVVTLVCVTLVPALMAMLGPRLFGVREAPAEGPPEPVSPRRHHPRFAGLLGVLRASRRAARAEDRSVVMAFVVRIVAARPVAAVVAVACVGVLIVAAAGVRGIDFSVSFVASLPADSEPRRAGDAAAAAFMPGIVAPAEIVLEQPGVDRRPARLARLQRLIASEPGIALVLGPAQAVGDPRRFVVSRRGAARYVLVMRDEPTGARAIAAFGRLEERMPGLLRAAGLAGGARVSYGGETALAHETVQSLVGDLWRVAIVTAVVMLLLLAIMMRALVAPVLLLAGSALACAASFGVTALLAPELFGGRDLVYYVPLVGGVMLVGLGSDYNVLLAGRIREEMRRRRPREAIAVAAPAASRAITVAGITLAATFGLLALVPLESFRQLALLMALGVLIDALFVRPLLIPALIAVAGRVTWWPSRLRPATSARAFYSEVAARSRQDTAYAAEISHATLATLAEQLPAREAHELARRLPDELAASVAGVEARALSSDEYLARVAERARVSTRAAAQDAPVVVSVLASMLPGSEIEYLRSALPADYAWLFDDAPPAQERATLAASP